MKKIFTLFLGSLCLVNFLSADIDIGTTTYNQFTMEEAEEADKGPFLIEISGDSVWKAKFDEELIDHQHFAFREVDIDASVNFYYNKCYKEGASLILGYNFTCLDWKENPFFQKKKFNTLSLSLGVFTNRLSNWFWISQVGINVDADHFNIDQYAYYDFLAWGRYSYLPGIGLHVGILVVTGMKIDRVYPVIGFDWTINDNWQLNAVFPMDMSLEYYLSDCWSLALAGRFFDQRQRVGKSEPLSKGLWNYRAAGLEFGINYDCDDNITANFHIGSTFGGVLKIADQHYDNKFRLKFKSSGYIGGEVAVRF